MADRVEPRYHVSPSTNRNSILRHGLDWKRMHANARGIACGWRGRPDAEGIYLTHPDIFDTRFFARMGAGRRVDVWRVDVTGLPLEDLHSQGDWWICREPIPPERLELIEVWDTAPDFGELREVPLPPRPPRRTKQRK